MTRASLSIDHLLSTTQLDNPGLAPADVVAKTRAAVASQIADLQATLAQLEDLEGKSTADLEKTGLLREGKFIPRHIQITRAGDRRSYGYQPSPSPTPSFGHQTPPEDPRRSLSASPPPPARAAFDHVHQHPNAGLGVTTRGRPNPCV